MAPLLYRHLANEFGLKFKVVYEIAPVLYCHLASQFKFKFKLIF